MLGLVSWMMDGHARLCGSDEDWPTACKMTSVIAVDENSPKRDSSSLVTIPETLEETLQMQQLQNQMSVHSVSLAEVPLEGDLVILGRRVQPEFQLCWAAVVSVEENFCKVAVLDTTKSFCIGECCPRFSEMLPVNSDWRVGSRLVIGGLQSSHMSQLNGLTGVVHPHKRHGHPCFLPRPGGPDDGRMWLNICIRLEDPEKASMHAVLLEPNLLSPCAPLPTPKTLSMQDRPNHKSSGYERGLSSASTIGDQSYSRTTSLPSAASFSSTSSNREMSPVRRLREIDELKETLKEMARQ